MLRRLHNMALDAIIFDFDGVIIDTETPDLEVWQEFFRSHGLDAPASLWATRTGYNEGDAFDPASYFERLTGQRLDEVCRQEQFQRYVDRCRQQPILPGVRNLLQQASQRGIKLAIASASYRSWVEPLLRQHKLWHYFDCVCTREDVKQGKPAPDLYLAAANCLGLPVDRCVAVEDSPNGIRAALAAGVRCIAVPNPLTARLAGPEVSMTVPSLADLELQALLTRF
jgi:HAD superfamily hydrolase (TIGR01509 family)